MSKVTIQFELKDENYCDGCPCLNNDYENGNSCNMGYWDGIEYDYFKWLNSKTGELQKEYPSFNKEDWKLVIPRPQQCKDMSDKVKEKSV